MEGSSILDDLLYLQALMGWKRATFIKVDIWGQAVISSSLMMSKIDLST